MEKNRVMPAISVCSMDDEDSKYVSGLSTILVATIQEAKDRISQIEFLFCNQLYPCIQSRSKQFRRVLDEATKEVEDEWRAKEKALLNRIQSLETEKQGMVENSVRLVLEKRMKEREDENYSLHDELKCLKIAREAVVEDKVLIEEKLRKLQSNVSENNELMKEYEKEKIELMCNLRYTEDTNSGLREELEMKNRELHNERVLTAKLHSKIDSNVDQIVKHGEKLKEVENEKELLTDKVNDLEKQVVELQGKLGGNINLNPNEETKKFKVLLETYKKARSENIYLRKKLNLTKENMIEHRETDNSRPLLDDHQALSHNGFEDRKVEKSLAAPTSIPVKREEEIADNERADESAAFVSCRSAWFSNQIPPKSVTVAKSPPTKVSRSNGSSWINTRSNQSKNMADPHDDFLDTPLENIKEKLSKSAVQGFDHYRAPIQQEADLGCSTDETDEGNHEPAQTVVRQSGKRSFKFIETVKTKAERQKLKGVECKQCKKFYDAVLPDRENDFTGNQGDRRCEHDEGVSRHRYRYVPPSTPEGFWNIGFESEM